MNLTTRTCIVSKLERIALTRCELMGENELSDSPKQAATPGEGLVRLGPPRVSNHEFVRTKNGIDSIRNFLTCISYRLYGCSMCKWLKWANIQKVYVFYTNFYIVSMKMCIVTFNSVFRTFTHCIYFVEMSNNKQKKKNKQTICMNLRFLPNPIIRRPT